MKKGVFIIEDNSEDYQKVKLELLPHDCYSLLDTRSNDEYSKDLSEDEKSSIDIFVETKNGSLRQSENYVLDILQNNQDNLRMIILDLEINGNEEGGRQILKAINTLGDNNNKFAQQIPILILSKVTAKTAIDAVREIMGRCFYLTKENAYGSVNVVRDLISYMVRDFDTKYKKLKFEKRYKVAFSFTGFTINKNKKEVDLRGFIEDIARKLYGEFREERVFYDMDKPHQTASLTPKQLAEKYNDSEYIVVFLSKRYVDKLSKYAKEEWDIIQKLVDEKRVVFVKLDYEIKEDDFKKNLSIEDRIYLDFTAYCSRYNEIMDGEDDRYKTYMYKNFVTQPVIKIAEEAIKYYKEILRIEISEAANLIIRTIKYLDDNRI